MRRSSIVDERYRNLVATEPVQFDVERTSKGVAAVNVESLLSENRQRGVVKLYDQKEGIGIIIADDTGTEVSVRRNNILGRSLTERKLCEDELVEYWAKGTRSGLEAREVKRLDSRYPLYRFANLGPEERWLRKLAEIAADDEDDWRYKDGPDGNCSLPVLRSYLIYTFRRLQEEYREGRILLLWFR